MNIHQYLCAVKAGKSINAHRLNELLKDKGLSIDAVGNLSYEKPGKYFLSIKDEFLLDEWIAKFAPSTSREDASIRLGNSHRHPTSATYLIAKSLDNIGFDFVIKCEKVDPINNTANRWKDNTAILIENSECYTQSARFLANMGIEPSKDTILIWSAGNAITHAHTIVTLSAFKHIYYCPDYDLAGIEIYETLSKTLGKNMTFVMPDNLEKYSAFCMKPENDKHFIKALEKAQKHSFTPMVALLKKGMGVLEQEVIIRGNI